MSFSEIFCLIRFALLVTPAEMPVPSTGLRRAHSSVLIVTQMAQKAPLASMGFQAERPRELADQQACTPQE